MTRHSQRGARFCVAAFAAMMLAVPALQAQVIDPDLESRLPELGPRDRVSVIVRFADRVGLSQFQDADKGLLRADIVAALKAQSYASQSAVEHLLDGPSVERRVALWAINGLALTTSAQIISALARNPSVARISIDAVVEAPRPEAGSTAVPEWNLDLIRAPELWTAGHAGAGVVVGGMDTGVDVLHPDLAVSYRGGSNSWLDPYGQHASPHDVNGHGTQSMGLIVGGSAGGSAIGVAPDARWIAAKIFNDAGSSTLSAIHQGFQWMLDPDGNPGTDDGADVVNNSWSLANVGGCSLEFEQDLQVLKAAQVAVVFAGGNYGPYPGTSVSPANNPSGFGVGSIDDLSLISSSSSTGPSACDGTVYPEVVAPGVSVRTADLTYGGTFPDSYISANGTSFAAPHVAGGLAVLLSAYPNATVGNLEQSLKETAVDLGASGPDNAYGYGRIDLVAAAAWLANPPGPTCNDLDGDLFFAEEGCGTPIDCNDLDPGINPAACDIKNDGIDQDCDGVDRTRGKACPPSPSPPTAADDAATTWADVSVTINVLLNDTDPDDNLDPGSVTVTQAAGHGTAAASADGSVTYTPETGFSGSDSFGYRVCDTTLLCDEAVVSVTVLAGAPANTPPTAVDDSASTRRNTVVTFSVTANDWDGDGLIDVTTVAFPAGGTTAQGGTVVSHGDGTVTYQPPGGFRGTDTFAYTVKDDDGATSNVATVTVTVKK